MTTFLALAIAFILLTVYLTQRIKRVIVSKVDDSGRVGPQYVAENTRLDVWKEWLRPMAWGVAVGAVACPACGYWVGWWR